MTSPRTSRRWQPPVAAAAIAALVAMTAAGAQAAPADVAAGLDRGDASSLGQVEKNQVPADSGVTTVFIEFDLPTTLDTVSIRSGLTAQQKRDVANVASSINATADSVVDELADADVLYTTVNGLAGVAVSVDAAQLGKIAQRDDVVSIRPIILKEPTSNAGSNAFTGTTNAWEEYGATGEGQTVAIIDTGVDFSHKSFNPDFDGVYPDTYAGNESFFTDDVTWPQGKVIGGYDFVGHAYTGGHTPAPAVPDANPMDESVAMCADVPASVPRGSGHGSHVAGTAAGWGVTQEGETYQGGYTGVDSSVFTDLKVGPGSAPDADIVALKVFGCAGSTGYVGAALDWLLDPTNEVAQAVDVVNLSVGSDFSSADDPENALVDRLSEAGKVVVISSGNAGDTFDIGGSPGNSNSALTVANSVGNAFELEAAYLSTGSADAEPEVIAGQYSIAYTFPDGPVGPSELVTLTPGTLNYNSGCLAYSAEDAATVAGKTVVVAWDDNTALPCGSAVRAGNAADAGAEGIIFTGVNEVFSAGLSGDARIPTFQFTAPGTAEFLNYDPATGVISIKEPTWITYDPTLSTVITANGVADTLNDSSSRGVHGSLGISKPDVAAPGTTISSVGVGTGDGTAIMSGTSMAAPHTAGIAAISYGAHPEFEAWQVKAAVMNTANHDLHFDAETNFGPQRVGSGRVDGTGAVATSVIAYDTDNREGVSVTFGVLEVSEALTLTRSVTVENHGDAEVTLGTSYLPQTEMPGVEYTVSPASITVAAGGSQQVEVTLTIADPAALSKVLDPAMLADQGIGVPREYLSLAQGWLELSGAPDVEGNLRVPVSAAPKPVANLSASDVIFSSKLATTGTLELTGTGIDQDGYFSIVAPFQLAAESDNENYTNSLSASDLKAVGTAPVSLYGNEDGVAFGISTWGPWATLGGSMFIEITVENENAGSPYTVSVQKFSDGIDDYDTTIVGVWDKNGTNTGLELLNDQAGNVDTNSYDSAALVAPVDLEALGYNTQSASFSSSDVTFDYSVDTYSYLANEADGYWVDSLTDLTYDGDTNLRFGDGSTLYVGEAGSGIEVRRPYSTAEAGAGASTDAVVEVVPTDISVLLLSLHNAVGKQDIILKTSDVEPTTPAEQVFVDVPANIPFAHEIGWLYTKGVTNGWLMEDGTREFRPYSYVTRDAMAAFLYRAIGSPEFEAPAVSPFLDVNQENTEFYKEITWVADQGIAEGWPTEAGAEYRPFAHITRDAISAFLFRYAENADIEGADDWVAPEVSPFIDVDQDNTEFYTEITWMHAREISTGSEVSPGVYEFKPWDNLQRDAMAAFLYRIMH